MSFGIFAAVMGAAFLHAFWNALVKTGVNKQTSMLMLTLGQSAIGLVMGLSRPFPGADVWVWILASALIHTVYQLFLAYAYEQGDLSRVYPIARGTAPLIVLGVSVAFLPDPVSALEYLGIAVLGAGIVWLARGAFTSGESRRLVPYALGAACATAGYSIVDGLGARIEEDAVAYVGWLLALAGVFYVPVVLALRGRRTAVAPLKAWGVGLVASAASMTAYAIVVWAMTQAPIALVTALRETSILFAVLIGWLVFGERMDRGKAIAAALILSGVMLTRLG